VDNDFNKSAKNIVENIKQTSSFSFGYFNEPEQNIAIARNKAVDNAKGNFIAFIDDDEFPKSTWLLNLYKTLVDYGSDGVLGPVKPYYPDNAPAWLIKSKLCDRSTRQTGTVVNWRETRTGNVLLKKKIFENMNNRFGPEFGRTGGEDIEFFKKIIENGMEFVWCKEATVYEIVPPERWSKTFYVKRYLRIGGLVGEKIRRREPFQNQLYALIKSITWISMLSILLPCSILSGQHIYMRFITKIMYNLGLISGFAGRAIIRYRDD
jgi:glycosyltransferase involved in cell wall biosynthesis